MLFFLDLFLLLNFLVGISYICAVMCEIVLELALTDLLRALQRTLCTYYTAGVPALLPPGPGRADGAPAHHAHLLAPGWRQCRQWRRCGGAVGRVADGSGRGQLPRGGEPGRGGGRERGQHQPRVKLGASAGLCYVLKPKNEAEGPQYA